MSQRLGDFGENLDAGEIFTLRLPFSRCDACGLLILLHSHRCFSVWSDFGQLTFYEHVENDAPSLQDAVLGFPLKRRLCENGGTV